MVLGFQQWVAWMAETPARESYVMPFNVRYTDHRNSTATGTQRRENPKRSLSDSSWANSPLEQKAADRLKAHRDGLEGKGTKRNTLSWGLSPLDQEEISLKLMDSILDPSVRQKSKSSCSYNNTAPCCPENP